MGTYEKEISQHIIKKTPQQYQNLLPPKEIIQPIFQNTSSCKHIYVTVHINIIEAKANTHTHTITCSKYYEINHMEISGSTLQLSRALGLELLVELVPVTWALMFVTISSRRDAVAFLAADPTVLEASVLQSSLRAPCLALAVTKCRSRDCCLKICEAH